VRRHSKRLIRLHDAQFFITILAAESFDPRLMGDAAARNPHRPLKFDTAPGLAEATE
jgi:hypothetical protein